jgi:hypothetical protein|tara:strand:- start:144 stop:413 length:270 start_codon:yes stop_codon:yes gene_type:complete
MREKERISKYVDSVSGHRSGQSEENKRLISESVNGGLIRGAEGGVRVDVFDHDENSEYDFSDSDCPVCELPEHAQNIILEEIEYEEGDA